MDVTFNFSGEVLVQEEEYLGLMMHASQDMTFGAEQRAVTINRSLHSMLQRPANRLGCPHSNVRSA